MRHPTLRAWLTLAPLALLVLTACAAREPSRSLYQWTDGDGSVRYTAFPDRVPIARAHTRRVVEPWAGAWENAGAPTPALESALPAPESALPAEATPPASHPLDARIAELEVRIAADEEILKSLISDPARAGSLRSSPQLREIGARLPELQAELDALREQRARAVGDDT